MNKPSRAQIYSPRYRLTDMVDRPGGIKRDIAIARARSLVETQRPPAIRELEVVICGLEKLASSSGLDLQENLPKARRMADRVINLATLYDYLPLADAAMRLSDLCQIFTETQSSDRRAFAVHVQALRLLQAGEGGAPAAKGILVGLDKVLAHARSNSVESSRSSDSLAR